MILSASRDGLRQRLPWLGDWWRGERASWLFVFKSLLAFYVAAWLAMRFELEQPSTTMITVALVMHPHSGMVLAKGFYRALGTVAGSLFGLLLMSLFPQQRVLFMLSLALWTGLCAGGATLYRNFMSYGFVLAGYTAAIVTLPVVDNPTGVFDSAVARVSEVMLGIFVSGVISDTLLPVRLRAILRSSAQGQFAQFIGFIRDSASGKLASKDVERAHLNFVSTAVRLEDLRSTVIFEDPEARARSGRMSLLNHYYMAASTSFQSVHHLINRMQRNGHSAAVDALIALYRPLGEALENPSQSQHDPVRLARRLDEARVMMPRLVGRLRETCADEESRTDFDMGANLLLRFSEELHRFASAEASLHETRLRGGVEKITFQRGNDVAAAAVAVLRTSLTTATVAVWWIISAWPYGSSAMLVAVIFSGLFATSPQPLAAVFKTCYGYGLGMLAAAIVTLGLLPMVDGYPLMIATSAPLLLIGPYMIAHPRLMPIGVGYTIGFVYIMSLKNPMVYNQLRFVNDALAQLFGIAMAGVAFIFFPRVAGSAWHRRRQAARLRRQVAVAAREPLRGLPARIESVSRDLFHQIVAHTAPESAEARDLVRWSLSVNESSRALIELRHYLAAKKPPAAARASIEAAIGAVAALYEAPSPQRWQAADQAVSAACEHLVSVGSRSDRPGHGALADLQLLRSALRDDESVLAAFIPGPSAMSPEVRHAP